MARSISEIYDQLIAEKESMTSLNALEPNIDSAQTLLDDLTSASKVAVWRLLFWVVAFSTWWHEQLFDEHKAEVEARAAELITAVPLWYRDQCLIFQYGDDLVWTGKKYAYDPIDENNRIIERAAVIEAGGQVRLKVAKLDGSGLPIPLTAPELAAFTPYIGQIKVAGTNTAIISQVGDDLNLQVKVYFDPLVLNSDGELISDPSVKPVEDAIVNHIQGLIFDGSLRLTRLTDDIQAAEGVVDPYIELAQGRSAPDPYTTFTESYDSEAGHMRIDPGIPINTMITYVADV